jgi:hypothetical protein
VEYLSNYILFFCYSPNNSLMAMGWAIWDMAATIWVAMGVIILAMVDNRVITCKEEEVADMAMDTSTGLYLN